MARRTDRPQSWRVRYPTGDGHTASVSGFTTNKWINNLHRLGYAPATVASIVKPLSMMLTDVDAERLITENPSAEGDAAHVGALHESTQRRRLGPPKTAASDRTITLPPFLIGLPRPYLERHTGKGLQTNNTYVSV